jgi:uracil-DNA glycosylase
VKILVVSKNPGHPLKGEPEKYIDRSGNDLLDAYREHQDVTYNNLEKTKDKSLVFHKNLFRYISFFLDIPNNVDSIYENMAHTNLVKCSTIGERDRLDKTTKKICFEKYLLDEIRLLQPKVLLALGGEVATFLNRMKKEYELPPVIRIKHPSYYYRKEIEKETLLQIKDRINKCLK